MCVEKPNLSVHAVLGSAASTVDCGAGELDDLATLAQ